MSNDVGAFARGAEKLLVLGYSPSPVRPGSKRPLLDKWDRLRAKPLTPQEVARLIRRWPALGLGVVGGYNCLVPVDVDSDDPDIVTAVCEALPEALVAKTGQRGFTAYYWDPSGMISGCKFRGTDGTVLVEVLVSGQTVIPPTCHPQTGRPYRWLTPETLFHIAVDSLPQITPEHIAALGERLRPWLPKPRQSISVRAKYDPLISDRRMLAYARAVVAGEVRLLAALGHGRNWQLYRAACKLGKYVHHHVLAFDEVEAALLGACEANGYLRKDGRNACLATLSSGILKAKGDALHGLSERREKAA